MVVLLAKPMVDHHGTLRDVRQGQLPRHVLTLAKSGPAPGSEESSAPPVATIGEGSTHLQMEVLLRSRE